MMLEQTRAALAYTHVHAVHTSEGEEFRKRYGVMALKLTALIRSAGLCQAVHFIASRNKDPYKRLLGDLAAQLKRVNSAITDEDSLRKRIREAQLGEYVHLTREALAVANWYARLAQSELNVKLTDDTGDEHED